MPYKRKCMDCGAEITACMGFVLAGDWLLAAEGKIPWTSIKERCGKCVERILIAKEIKRGLLNFQTEVRL